MAVLYIYAVNKALLILLFPVLVFNASLREVLKTPQLFSHFIVHHQLDEDLGFWGFIKMHYLGQDIDDNDEEEDMKLPFKKIDGHHIISLAVPADRILTLKITSAKLMDRPAFNYQITHTEPPFGSLFRPPIA